METPKTMKSTISNNDDTLIISTPKTKSWALIFIFSVLMLQSVYGIIKGFFFHKPLIPAEKIFLLTFCPIMILLTLKGLLWQFKGMKILEINSQKLIFKKVAPLKFRKREYDVKVIKSIEIGNEAVSIGPIAMLQLLGIIDRISINFSYGYDTVKTLSGSSMTEAIEIEKLIRSKIGNE